MPSSRRVTLGIFRSISAWKSLRANTRRRIGVTAVTVADRGRPLQGQRSRVQSSSPIRVAFIGSADTEVNNQFPFM